MNVRGDASEFFTLARLLSAAAPKVDPVVRRVMTTAGKDFADDWRANAAETSGTHGRHYPNSIDFEVIASPFAVAVDVGPNAAKPQGSMGRGFEFGSMNQPPHLDGLRALDAIEQGTDTALEDSIGPLIP